MSDAADNAQGVSAERANPTIAAAMALLQGAERAARSTRADAERYAREREAEADLLIQKARRLLVAAEAKAAVIVATAHAQKPAVRDRIIDLDEEARVDASASVLVPGSRVSELDKMLESAIAHAVTDAFPRSARS